MNDRSEKRDIWFIYDGECPLCASAAVALRIQEDYGILNLLNARHEKEHPIIMQINKLGIHIDAGMVIFDGSCFYHGKDALIFMARYGESKGLFNLFNKTLFWSRTLASILYPIMRGVRNTLLKIMRIQKIDNLHQNDKPIFMSIFGSAWDELPPVMHKHYANRPFTRDKFTVEGRLNIVCKPAFTFLAPVMRMMGQIPFRHEKNVPVTVHFESDVNSKVFTFNRVFHFLNSEPYVFRSSMLQTRGNEVVEMMRFGICWKMLYIWDGRKVILKHHGYALKLFGFFFPIPLALILGKGHAEEIAIDDNSFEMAMHITHPLWGRVYEYNGRFEVLILP